jgi:hypothetical protein
MRFSVRLATVVVSLAGAAALGPPQAAAQECQKVCTLHSDCGTSCHIGGEVNEWTTCGDLGLCEGDSVSFPNESRTFTLPSPQYCSDDRFCETVTASLYLSADGKYDKPVVVATPFSSSADERSRDELYLAELPFIKQARLRGYDIWMVETRTHANIHYQAASLAQVIDHAARRSPDGKTIAMGYSLGGLTTRIATATWQANEGFRGALGLTPELPVKLLAFGDSPLLGAHVNLDLQQFIWDQGEENSVGVGSCAAQQLLRCSVSGLSRQTDCAENWKKFFMRGNDPLYFAPDHDGDFQVDLGDGQKASACQAFPAVTKINGDGWPHPELTSDGVLFMIGFSDGMDGGQMCYGSKPDLDSDGHSVCDRYPGPTPAQLTAGEEMYRVTIPWDPQSIPATPDDLVGGSRFGIVDKLVLGFGIEQFFSPVFIPYTSALPADASFSATSANDFQGVHGLLYDKNLLFVLDQMDFVSAGEGVNGQSLDGGGGGTSCGPAAPTGLTATAFANQVKLSWTDNATDEDETDGYRVQRQTDGGAWDIIGVLPQNTTSTITNVELNPRGNTYCFKVRAKKGVGCNSDFSNIACVTVFKYAPSGPPLHLQPSDRCVDDTRPQFGWDEAPGTTSQWIVVEEFPLDGTPQPTPITVLSNPNLGAWYKFNYNLLDDLDKNRDFQWKLKACNNMGCGEWARYRPFSTICQPPIAPAQVRSSARLQQITLTWKEDANPEAGFRVERSADGGAWIEVKTIKAADVQRQDDNRIVFVDTVPVEPAGGHTDYTYHIIALNKWGESPVSPETGVTIYAEPPSEPPTAAAGVGCVPTTATASVYHASLGWTAPARAEWYNVAIHNASTQVWSTTTTSTLAEPDAVLNASSPYRWQIAACNNMGCIAAPQEWNFRACTPDDLPVFEPLGCIDNLQPRIRWQPVNGSKSHHLIVMRMADQQRVVDVYLAALANSYALTAALTPGLEYKTTVSASPSGTDSRPVYFTPTCNPGAAPGTAAPHSPLGGGDTHTPTRPLFIWDEAVQATGYRLYIDGNVAAEYPQASAICGGGQCAVFGPTLGLGPHNWQVQGTNAAGSGALSKKGSFVVGS